LSGLAFRRLGIEDLQQLYLWLGRPHVAKWYATPPGSFAEMLARYGPRTEPGSAVRSFIVRVDGADCGYAQAYPVAGFPGYARSLDCAPDAVGVDLFIADAWRLGRGLGTRVARRFVDDEVFGLGISECIAGPSEGNAAAIRTFERAGFARWKRVRMDDGEPEQVLRALALAQYRLASIDLGRDGATCVDFRRDAYVATFGTSEGMEAEMGADNALYLAQLRHRLAELPEGNAHLWDGARIVGQAEMRLVEDDATLGYVNLFYVLPELRGRGLGRVLHRHAVRVFSKLGKRAIRLSVSERNAQALAFYRKLGWRDAGSRPHREAMQVLELAL
jgi:ribosomal protein S18 acetylase RimI-like enzyme